MSFLQFFAQRHFRLPNIINNSGHRAASPLELFIDLAYVGMLSAVVHYLLGAEHIGSSETLGFVLRFMSMFTLWVNMVWYNNLFEDSTWRHRLLMLSLVFTVVIQQVSLNADVEQAVFILGAGYIASRLLYSWIWYRAVYREGVPEGLQQVSKHYILGGVLSAVLCGLSIVLFRNNEIIFLSIWTLTVVLEFVIPNVLAMRSFGQLYQAGRHHKLAKVSHHLYMERFSLIFILILGEGALAASKVVATYGEALWPALIVGALVLLLALLMWQLYFGVVNSVPYAQDKIFQWSFLNLPIFMGALLTLGLTVELYHPHHPENAGMLYNLFVVAFSMFILGISNAHHYRQDETTNLAKAGYSIEVVKRGRRQMQIWGLLFLMFLVIRVPHSALIGLAVFWLVGFVFRIEWTRYLSSKIHVSKELEGSE